MMYYDLSNPTCYCFKDKRHVRGGQYNSYYYHCSIGSGRGCKFLKQIDLYAGYDLLIVMSCGKAINSYYIKLMQFVHENNIENHSHEKYVTIHLNRQTAQNILKILDIVHFHDLCNKKQIE